MVKRMSEALEQEALIQWANFARQEFKELEMLFHIPNGAKREIRVGAALKRQGVKAGVPDLFLPVARGIYHGLFIEMKVGKNKQTAEQYIWETNLVRENYKVVVCYSWIEAKEVIIKYLKCLKYIKG